MTKLQHRLEKTGQLINNPAYKAEVDAIAARMHALDLKVKKALKFDAQGLKMWKLHMDNNVTKEIVAEDKAIKQEMAKFVKSHPKIHADLKDLEQDITAEFHAIGQRLEQTGKMLSDPKYKAELHAIGKKWAKLDARFKRNLHWDDEGLKMWKVSMDPKVDAEIKRDEAEIWRDIQNLDGPAHKLGLEFQKYDHDQAVNWMQIEARFNMMIKTLDTPKHRMQLQKIKARYERLQMYQQKEEHAIGMQLKAFLEQPEV